MKIEKNSITLIILPLLALFAACEDDSTSVNRSVNNTDFVATEIFEYKVEVVQHVGLSLDAINGTIAVTGIPDADTAIISGEKKVGSESLEDAQNYLPLLEIVIEDQLSNINVATEQPVNPYGRSFIVDYDIQVPDGFYVSVDAVNGFISIEAIDNNLNIRNVNGQILLNDIAGDVIATQSNGQITGNINLPIDGNLRLTTINGDIDLNIPDNTSAQFSASVANGIINISNLILQDEIITNNLVTGTLGDGSGDIELSVTNGTIDVAGY